MHASMMIMRIIAAHAYIMMMRRIMHGSMHAAGVHLLPGRAAGWEYPPQPERRYAPLWPGASGPVY